jgi:CrcB protein
VFPWGTLAVNILGCFLIGLIATLADEHRMLSPSLRLLIVPGILGGFTTFSTFGLETWRLIEDGLALAALGNAAASLVGGLAAIALAILVGRALG